MDKAAALLMQGALQGRAAPDLAQRLMGLGVYYMPQPQQVFNEWQTQPRTEEGPSNIQDVHDQLVASRRYNGGDLNGWVEDLQSQRNFNRNTLRGYTPYLGMIKV